jgi:hypothetical protein
MTARSVSFKHHDVQPVLRGRLDSASLHPLNCFEAVQPLRMLGVVVQEVPEPGDDASRLAQGVIVYGEAWAYDPANETARVEVVHELAEWLTGHGFEIDPASLQASMAAGSEIPEVTS